MTTEENPKKRPIAPWKIIVGVIAGLAGLLVLVVVGFVGFLAMNQDKIVKQGSLAKAQGAAYGASRTQSECLETVLGRLDTSGMMDQLKDRIFLDECFSKAKVSSDLCVDVPPESSFVASVSWRLKACADHGKEGNQACTRLMGNVQTLCHPSSKGGSRNDSVAE